MAKVGEGDPRWIVEHRDDGRNVNSWHWEEKCILKQVKQRLEEAFDNVECQSVTLTKARSITGEASINTRKGNKRLVVYDLTLTIDWESEVASKKVAGSVKVTEFASASDEDDYLFEVTTSGTGADGETAKRLFNSHGKPEVLARLISLAKELTDV